MKKLLLILIANVFINLPISAISQEKSKLQFHSVSAGIGMFTHAFDYKKNGLNGTFFNSDVAFILNRYIFPIYFGTGKGTNSIGLNF